MYTQKVNRDFRLNSARDVMNPFILVGKVSFDCNISNILCIAPKATEFWTRFNRENIYIHALRES